MQHGARTEGDAEDTCICTCSEPTGEPTSEPTGEPTSEATGEPTSELTGEPMGEPTSTTTTTTTTTSTQEPSDPTAPTAPTAPREEPTGLPLVVIDIRKPSDFAAANIGCSM